MLEIPVFVREMFYILYILLQICMLSLIYFLNCTRKQKYLNLMKSNLSVFSFIVVAYCELRHFA